ncbi:MAG TPA: hypothetical protein VEI97_20085 [bacterium]|nr:hypothetical protein [bacterium]
MFYNFGGPGHAMAFGGPGEAEGFIELELTVEDGTATAKGKTKDGKPFNLKGTVDEVNRELKELGITVEALKDAGDEMHIKLKGGPHGHAFAFTPPGGHGKAFFGHELTDEERAEIEREVARITDEADRLFEQGKTDEAMKKLHELHKYAMRLHGGPGSMAFGAPHGAMVFPGHDEREVRVIIGEALQDLDLEHLGPEVRAEIEAAVEDLDLENLGEEIRIELEEALGDIDVDVTEIQKEIDRAIAEVEKSRQYYRWGKDKDRAQADKQKATREADRAKERGGDAQAKDRKSDRKSGTDDQYNPGRRRDSDDRRRDEERKRLPDA